MKTTEIIKADVFVIPNNRRFCLKENFENICNWAFIADLQAVYHNKYRLFSDEEQKSIPSFDETKFVQVQYATPNDPKHDSNWCCHKIDGYQELKCWKAASEYLPEWMFRGYKEGDTITIDLPIKKLSCASEEEIDPDLEVSSSIKVAITLAQGKCRYRNYGDGKFEKVVAEVCD